VADPEGPGKAGPPNGEREAALAEFDALRREIDARSSSQHLVFNIGVTTAAAVVALSTATDSRLDATSRSLMLLVLPLALPALGILWFDHARNIDQIGDYIRTDLAEVVRFSGGGAHPFGYEAWVERYERTKLPRFTGLGVPIAVVFAGLPAAMLAVTAGGLGAWPNRWYAVWGLGALLTCAALVHLVVWLAASFAASGRTSAAPPPR
jgi:hypothetical protein